MKKQLFGTVALALFLVSILSAQQVPTGFSATAGTRQLDLEQLLKTLPKGETFSKHLQVLTSQPHPAGSPENLEVIKYMAASMEKAGLEVERYPYDIYLPTGPGEIEVGLVQPIRMPLNNMEYILEEDPFSADPRAAEGWNSYSGSGDVTAEVVYVNYGTKEDFEWLDKQGINVKGKIAVARYGGNFRGYKAKYAEAWGAAGLIIYSDPEDVGYMRGLTYPEGTYFSESTIQRGSLLTLDYTGDPLTPFEPALPMDGTEKVERLDPAKVDFHTIPVTPLPYGSAKEILSRMSGQPVPMSWQGGLPFTYRIEGGSELKVRLKVQQEKDFVRVENVVGTLTGTEYPDEWIILGGHFDAWVYGASDPNSGTAMLLTLADALGELAKQGYRPKRTIKIAHWDAEEHGIIASSEWVEQLREELNEKAIAYFNADGACSGLNFGGASSPTLKSLMLDATKDVRYGDSDQSVYEHWISRSRTPEKGPDIGNLGGGSDHLAFYAHAGIPSLSAGMGGPTLYHSAYDSYHWYKTFADPEFISGPTVARLFGVMAMRLANADVLPLDVKRYGQDLKMHLGNVVKEVRKYKADFELDGLIELASEIEMLGTDLDKRLSKKLSAKSIDMEGLAEINKQMIALERLFLDEEGMAYGKWYQSLYASSDPYSGYASWMLPGFLYEASLQSTENLAKLEMRYRKAMENLASAIEGLLKQ